MDKIGFLNTLKKWPFSFDQKVVERIEANQNQKDSVIGIVTNAFKKVDEILKTKNMKLIFGYG